MGPAAKAAGYRLDIFDTLGSTHDEAMARARAGDPGDLWIVAHEQTAGRGRMARPWSSPRGNLYASLLLIDPSPVANAPQLGFAAGIALADAVNVHLPSGAARLKWPNDLLVNGAKLAGLLIEATTLADGRFACAIGFGVNCASHPEDLPYAATSLAANNGATDPAVLFHTLSDAFPLWRDQWARGDGFASTRTAWLDRALPAGAPLRVRAGDAISEGLFSTIDEQGRLVLDCGGNVRTFDAGDVFPAAGAIGRNVYSGAKQ